MDSPIGGSEITPKSNSKSTAPPLKSIQRRGSMDSSTRSEHKFLLQRIAESEQTANLLTNKKSRFFVFQMPLLVMLGLVLLGGIGIAIGFVLGMQQRDIDEQVQGLMPDINQRAPLLQQAATQALANAVSVASYVAMMPSLTSSQFSSFISSNRLAADWFISDITYAPIVDDAALFRQQHNYSIFTSDASGYMIPSPGTSDGHYSPSMYIMLGGWNFISTFSRGEDLLQDKALYHAVGVAQTTGRAAYALPNTIAVMDNNVTFYSFWGQQIIAPVVKNGATVALIRTRINLPYLLGTYFPLDVLTKMDVTLFCTHINDQPLPGKPRYIMTNMDGNRFVSRGLSDTNHTQIESDPNLQDRLWNYVQDLKSQQGMLLERQMTFGALNVTAYFTATPEYLTTFIPMIARRWSLFAVILIITGIVMMLVGLGMLFIHTCGLTIQVLQHRLIDLKKTKNQMNSLIEQLSLEEERTRIALSVMPMGIAFFDASGNLVFANETFISLLHYAEHDVTSGTINVQKLLPQLDMAGILQRRPKRFAVTTTVASAFNVEAPYFVTVTFLSNRNTAAANPFKDIAKTETSRKFQADFIVTVDHRGVGTASEMTTDNELTDLGTSSDSEHRGGPSDDQLFEGMFKDDAPLMVAFSDFCAREHSEEGLAFYRAVCDYRRISDTFTRVRRQQEIYFEFLHEMAFQPLNLPGNMETSRELEKIRKNLGQPDVFDNVLALVLQEMRHDLFERFMYMKRTGAFSNPVSPDVDSSIQLQDVHIEQQ